jgi:hypothetical protein
MKSLDTGLALVSCCFERNIVPDLLVVPFSMEKEAFQRFPSDFTKCTVTVAFMRELGPTRLLQGELWPPSAVSEYLNSVPGWIFSPTVHKSALLGGLRNEVSGAEKPPPSTIITRLTLTPKPAKIPKARTTLPLRDTAL